MYRSSAFLFSLLASLMGCTTVHSVGGGGNGDFYVVAQKSYIVFPGPTYVIHCSPTAPGAGVVSCEQIATAEDFGPLAVPGASVNLRTGATGTCQQK